MLGALASLVRRGLALLGEASALARASCEARGPPVQRAGHRDG